MAVILWILAVLLGILVFLLLLGLVLLWVRAGVEAVGATGAVSVEARYGLIRIPVWPRPKHVKRPAPEKTGEAPPKPKKPRKSPKYRYSLNREALDIGELITLAMALLDEMAEEFPPEFYDELNGGIALLPEAKEDPEGEHGELYIMGEYCNDMMGKYINLYYGSFAALAGQEDWTEEDWEDELYTTLAHEFTHHIEGRAGERGLERKDEQFMEEFRAGRGE